MPEKEIDSAIQTFYTVETMFDPIQKKIDNEFEYIYFTYMDKEDN